jgi:hypothetical protein
VAFRAAARDGRPHDDVRDPRQDAHLVVWRDQGEDGDDVWQFHCGNGDYDAQRLLLVRLEEILDIDPTVAGVAHLAVGQAARRVAVGEPWTITTEH